MTTEKAFGRLIKIWETLPDEYRIKHRMYKSRYLNISGKQKRKVGPEKMKELLLGAGIKFKPEEWTFPKGKELSKVKLVKK